MWEILLNSADWDCFRILILRRFGRFKIYFWGALCIFGSHTFVPISWMCKKQHQFLTVQSESEIISLDTGLRLDGLPALELWDLIVSVLGNVPRVSDSTGKPVADVDKT